MSDGYENAKTAHERLRRERQEREADEAQRGPALNDDRSICMCQYCVASRQEIDPVMEAEAAAEAEVLVSDRRPEYWLTGAKAHAAGNSPELNGAGVDAELAPHDRDGPASTRPPTINLVRTGFEALKKLEQPRSHLPLGAAERKGIPLATGLFDYFPDALAAVAALSKVGNDQHNPGKPMRHDRSKSGDEADTLLRHLLDRGTVDTDGVRHSTKAAWRALSLLQKELEESNGLSLPRGAVASH